MLALPPKYPPVLCELADCVYRCLSASLPVERAGRLALDITGALQRQFVGCLLYIPKGEEFERERRNDALLRDFNGRNHRELARKYGLALATVYAILSEQREKKPED